MASAASGVAQARHRRRWCRLCADGRRDTTSVLGYRSFSLPPLLSGRTHYDSNDHDGRRDTTSVLGYRSFSLPPLLSGRTHYDSNDHDSGVLGWPNGSHGRNSAGEPSPERLLLRPPGAPSGVLGWPNGSHGRNSAGEPSPERLLLRPPGAPSIRTRLAKVGGPRATRAWPSHAVMAQPVGPSAQFARAWPRSAALGPLALGPRMR